MKEVNIRVPNLQLELTRKCNLVCGHCLRGACQNKQMSDETMRRIFEDIDCAFQLSFVGGESSLAVDRLKKLEEILKEKQTDVRCLIVFTNAVDISDEYIQALQALKEYVAKNNADKYKDIDSNYKGFVKRMDKRTFALRIVASLDKFHLESMDNLKSKQNDVRETVKQNLERLARNFPVEIDKLCNYTIYDEGRGKNISNIYKNKVPLDQYALLYWKMKEGSKMKDLLVVGPMINISFDGKIIETNKSYEYCDSHSLGNINQETFLQMCKHLKSTKGYKQYNDFEPLYKAFNKILHRMNTTTKELQKMQKFYKNSNIQPDFSYFTQSGPVGYQELTQKQAPKTSAIEKTL